MKEENRVQAGAAEQTPVTGGEEKKGDSRRLKSLQPSESFPLAVILTLVGGFLDTYTYICRDGVFANAQTGNFAKMAISLAEGDFFAVLRYLVSILSFIAGVTIAIWIRYWMKNRNFLHWRQVNILLEMALLLVISFIPSGDVSNIFANILVSMTCAIQLETFRRFRGNVFASTMCTGNLRSATESLNHYFQKQEPEKLENSVRYLSIDVVFVIGAVIGTLCTRAWSVRAALVCCGALAAAFILMISTPDSAGE